MISPKAKVLTYQNEFDNWSVVTVPYIKRIFSMIPENQWPKTNVGRVRLFIESEKPRRRIVLNRYFDTIDYEMDEIYRSNNKMEAQL